MSGLLLRGLCGLLGAQACGWAGAYAQQPPGHALAAASLCSWADAEVWGPWRLGPLLWLLAYSGWCYRTFCGTIALYVDMPRLAPAEYEPPANGASLGSLR